MVLINTASSNPNRSKHSPILALGRARTPSVTQRDRELLGGKKDRRIRILKTTGLISSNDRLTVEIQSPNPGAFRKVNSLQIDPDDTRAGSNLEIVNSVFLIRHGTPDLD